MDKILYFPYINLPNNDWTNKAILYWDEVGAIVPSIYTSKPKRLEQHMLDLVRSELVRQVVPYQYAGGSTFDETFIDRIERSREIERRQEQFSKGVVHRIHIEKIGNEIKRYLIEKELAARHNSEWYFIEEATAKEFMFYLASVIAIKGEFTPATDDLKNFNLKFSKTFRLDQSLSKVRDEVLDKILPYPADPISPYQIAMFKHKYHDELKRFRTNVELLILEATNYPEGEPKRRFIELKSNELNEEKREIENRLREGKLGQIIFGTVCGVVSAIQAYDPNNPATGLPGLLNSIYSGFQGYSHGAPLRSKMAYLALFNRKFSKTRVDQG